MILMETTKRKTSKCTHDSCTHAEWIAWIATTHGDGDAAFRSSHPVRRAAAARGRPASPGAAEPTETQIGICRGCPSGRFPVSLALPKQCKRGITCARRRQSLDTKDVLTHNTQ
eukprot:COSAG03_NODE_46_length_16816_cov_6.510492_16_plen_114_part_00